MKVLTVFDAGVGVGAGHQKRCQILAKELEKEGVETLLIAGGGLQQAGMAVTMTPGKTFVCFAMEFVRDFAVQNECQLVLFDVVHQQTHKALRDFTVGVQAMSADGLLVGLIDSFGAESLRTCLPELHWDVIIAPYVGEEDDDSGVGLKLFGPGYFPLDLDIAEMRPRQLRDPATRVLITLGGSDPSRTSLKSIRALQSLDVRGLEIRCVVGPYFDESLQQELAQSVAEDDRFKLVHSPPDLTSYFKWCDVAISASGLTKYELAAAGVPAILISLNKLHHEINKIFMRAGSAIDIGIADEVDDVRIADAMKRLLGNFGLRKMLSSNGQRLVDGQGLACIVSSLIRLMGNQMKMENM